MGTIRFADVASTPWVVARDKVTGDLLDKIAEDELDNTFSRTHSPGSENDPWMMEMKFSPGTLVDQHAHDQSQIMYVLEGEMHMGAKVLEPGMSVMIPANTLYSFRAGPEGLRMLNFRPSAGAAFMTKREFLETRSSS